MYFRSVTIYKTELEAAYNAGKSLCLLCGNNAVNEISDDGTALWHGASGKPSYIYNKQWFVPRVSSDGVGSTLATIIQYLSTASLNSVTFTVKNEVLDVIDDDYTTACFVAGQVYFDEWEIPDDDHCLD